MIHVLMMFAALGQGPDTVGVRQALTASIVAVERHVAAGNPWFESSEHIVVDVPSFLHVMGIDSTEAVRWHSLLDSLGSRASDHSEYCAAGGRNMCPALWAQGLTRSGNTYDLNVVVSYEFPPAPTSTNRHRRGVHLELHVILQRSGDIYHVKEVKYGMVS